MLGARGVLFQDGNMSNKVFPGSNMKAHCPAERLAKTQLDFYGLSVSNLTIRADVIGYISQAVQEKGMNIDSKIKICLGAT